MESWKRKTMWIRKRKKQPNWVQRNSKKLSNNAQFKREAESEVGE